MAEVLNMREMAKRCRIPMRWVETEAKAGRLPHLKIGKRLFFNPAAVIDELARRAAAGTGDAPTAAAPEAAPAAG